jgi:hypothetical protein
MRCGVIIGCHSIHTGSHHYSIAHYYRTKWTATLVDIFLGKFGCHIHKSYVIFC